MLPAILVDFRLIYLSSELPRGTVLVANGGLTPCKENPVMWMIRTTFVTIWLTAFGMPGRAEIIVLQDPDKWIEAGLQDIISGKTDEFAHNYLKLVDKPELFDAFAGNLRTLASMGAPAFMDKVSDVTFGTSLRELIYVALYKQFDYTYFRFTIKKNRGGWTISNFTFKGEPGEVFPPGFRH
jgi:hypothetical protein